MWSEIKTAYQVAKLGTISAAAESLGVHRATVIRHIDALEAELGQKLFQRHAKGYTPTEVGLDLLQVAKTTDEQFEQWLQRSQGKGNELKGELIITAIEAATPLLLPAISKFKNEHPQVMVRYLASERVFKMEYGEAHISLRTGAKPEDEDNVVQHFLTAKVALYAHSSYIQLYGKPQSMDDFNQHYFIGTDHTAVKRSFQSWLAEHVRLENMIFLTSSAVAIEQAICAGLGMGLLPQYVAQKYPELIEVMPPQEAWNVDCWLVTHGDLHRTEKVQAFLRLLKH